MIRLNVKRGSCNMISEVTNQGTARCRIFKCNINADRLIDFMMSLLKDAKCF